MKKLLLTVLATTGLMGATVAMADGHGNSHGNRQQGLSGCDNNNSKPFGKMKGQRGRHGGRNHGMRGNMFKGIQLTDAQEEQMKAIFENNNAIERAELRDQQRELFDKKQQLIQSEHFDAVAFQALTAEQDRLRAEQRLKRAEQSNQAWNLLTTEQQQKIKERFNDRRELMEKKREYRQKWQNTPNTDK